MMERRYEEIMADNDCFSQNKKNELIPFTASIRTVEPKHRAITEMFIHTQ